MRNVKATKAPRFEIITDGVTVWVNGAIGLLGRFGTRGVDVHQEPNQQSTLGECLYCTHEATKLEDWRAFQEKMAQHHGIPVSDRYMPKRIREQV